MMDGGQISSSETLSLDVLVSCPTQDIIQVKHDEELLLRPHDGAKPSVTDC